MQELLDVVSDKNKLTGIKKTRKTIHRNGDWHRTSHVWILDNANQVLCNKRSNRKDIFPGKWEPLVGGHVRAGETYKKTAVREVLEELGLKAKPSNLRLITNFRIDQKDLSTGSINREFVKVFLLTYEKSLKELNFKHDEIDQIKFFPLLKIANKPKNFIPAWEYYKTVAGILSRR